VRFLTWLVSTAAAVAAAAWLFDGIWFAPRHGDAVDKLVPLLLVSLILGGVSMFVKPVLKILSIPFIILTLGLFLLVINAGMLMLTSWLADLLDIGFHVEGFWVAVGGAIVITVVEWVVDGLLGSDRD
jgi:putative membrane protein